MSPQRIQRRRTPGWRMPENAVYVGRPTKWGNPWRLVDETHTDFGPVVAVVHDDGSRHRGPTAQYTRANGQWWAARLYGETVVWPNPEMQDAIRRELAGKDLACWCKPGDPCHADVLLEIANGGEPR
ncbi:DUF4326 domain-containing protein [Micromonospora tulbaghiae]|uniref:DUF4326 domain-containing protein n=1 Tax=Micromonospora tulbaghiae TaxID=479978 RepID=UPI0033D410B9